MNLLLNLICAFMYAFRERLRKLCMCFQSRKCHYAAMVSSKRVKSATADGKKIAGTRVVFPNVVIRRQARHPVHSHRVPFVVLAKYVNAGYDTVRHAFQTDLSYSFHTTPRIFSFVKSKLIN